MALNADGNVILDEYFVQVCVMQSTTLGGATPEDFVKWIADNFKGVRIQFLEVIMTNPDLEDVCGFLRPVAGTGGRSDILFAVHVEDIGKFAIPRLACGIRWIEDAYANGDGRLYPERVSKYTCW